MTSERLGSLIGRRAVLRGAGLGLAGVAGAALFGCSNSKPSSGGSSSGGSSGDAASNGAPKNIKRVADGTFMKAFRDKGFFRQFMEKMPVHVVMEQKTALIGAAQYAVSHAA